MRTLFILFLACSLHGADLQNKVLLGYQGWFHCPGDGWPPNSWSSWARGIPGPGTLTVDMYPDLTELAAAEGCAVPGLTIGGKQAYLYTAWNRETVLRHFRWMKQYGLDGVLVQRFVGNIARDRASGDVVLKNVMAGAAASGRVFAIEYDISGGKPETFSKILLDDWAYLTSELRVADAPGYLRHNGKPLVSVWGMGLNEDGHPPTDPAAAKALIDAFKTLGVAYMGGTPSRWRTFTNDARRDPEWAAVYAAMDVVQPWTVGRYRDLATADRWKQDFIAPDLALAAKNHQLYMPVVFPGVSWHNLKPGSPKNQIPRLGGEFLWRQAYNAKMAGAALLKIAMFDEVNEGTAVFKIAPHRKDAPDQGDWLTLDADGLDLPSDWYLRLSGEITKMFHGEIPPREKLPIR